MKRTIGGDRLGSGKKMKAELHNYERSTHDLGYLWRSTLSAGTLVPFLCKVGQPGDTWDINLDTIMNTLPTIGPLYGSSKVQLDVFSGDFRLYQGQLHNNKIGIGMNMSKVKLPLLSLTAQKIDPSTIDTIADLDNAQINPSSLIHYLGIHGVGIHNEVANFTRSFNGIPYLLYWDIYKNYYANKQEEIGACIHTIPVASVTNVTTFDLDGTAVVINTFTPLPLTQSSILTITASAAQPLDQLVITLENGNTYGLLEAFDLANTAGFVYTLVYKWPALGNQTFTLWKYRTNETIQTPPTVVTFNLENIDTMREKILAHAVNSTAFDINAANLEPYKFIYQSIGTDYSMMKSQECLALKTYQNDLFNNWLNTEWIDGVNGISEVSAIDVSGGKLYMDSINLQEKVYNMLNRIAVSGGTYDDWIDVNYTENRMKSVETPVYHGGLIKELVFQEVVSNANAEGTEGNQPLGTIAGKGILARKHKGGNITVKCHQHCYILGILSITPRIDYSQGNNWDTHLETMDDLHKSALDGIGYQELITEQMAWWSTNWDAVNNKWVTKSAGKQPAWLNYMTSINETHGNFAVPDNQMFMTNNRRYEPTEDSGEVVIQDLTTYIDPSKFNNIFAQTALDSQNYWAQIAVDITLRRKISAKIIPNL